MASIESMKTEQTLGINSFNEPLELSGVDAWAKLVTNLLFMRPGTMPTDPNMGCHLQQYDFSFIDEVKDEIQNLIQDQVSTYLPEVPLDSVSVNKDESSGQPVLLIILSFNTGDNDIAVVAAEKNTSTNILNFAIV